MRPIHPSPDEFNDGRDLMNCEDLLAYCIYKKKKAEEECWVTRYFVVFWSLICEMDMIHQECIWGKLLLIKKYTQKTHRSH